MKIAQFFARGLFAATLMGGSFSANALLITNTGLQAGNPASDLYDVTVNSADVGSSFNVAWSVPAGTGALTHDLSGFMTVTINAFTASTLDLGISITNTTDVDGSFQAAIHSFGFGIDPDATASVLSAGSVFTDVGSGNGAQQTFPGGFKQIDFCAFSPNNCSGGSAPNGLAGDGASDSLVVRLTANTANAFDTGSDLEAVLMAFPVKYQTDEGSYEPAGVVSAVPVPAAVWLFGSGLLGLAAAARRKAA